jgi:hypothetical protein
MSRAAFVAAVALKVDIGAACAKPCAVVIVGEVEGFPPTASNFPACEPVA